MEEVEFVEPMKAKLVTRPPSGAEWLYELKLDGYRGLALKEGGQVRIISRNGQDLSGKFPAVVDALASLRSRRAVLDGELVALDSEGKPSFELLQRYNPKRTPLYFYAFDLLHLNGNDLEHLPLTVRKQRLGAILKRAPEPVRFSCELQGDPEQLLNEIRRRGLEGLIAKRRDSRYEPGRRSGAWLKIKIPQEDIFRIGGYTAPSGSRRYFGALLLGRFEAGRLVYVGKVGTGFSEVRLQAIYSELEKRRRKESPFFEKLPRELASSRWVEPLLECRVRFSEWTNDGILRTPSFIAMGRL